MAASVIPSITEQRYTQTRSYSRLVSWFELFAKRVRQYNAVPLSKFIDNLEIVYEFTKDLREQDKVSTDFERTQLQKFAKKFKKICDKIFTRCDATGKLHVDINSIDDLFIKKLNTLIDEWDKNMQLIKRACEAKSMQEISYVYTIDVFVMHVARYAAYWQNPSEDIIVDQWSTGSSIMLLWIIETMRSAGGPSIIQQLLDVMGVGDIINISVLGKRSSEKSYQAEVQDTCKRMRQMHMA